LVDPWVDLEGVVMTQKKSKRSRGTKGIASIPTLPGKLEQLRESRQRGPVPLSLKEYALRQVADGMSGADAARLIGVTAECVRLWLRREGDAEDRAIDETNLSRDGSSTVPVDSTPLESPAQTSADPVPSTSSSSKDHAQGISSQEETAILNVKKSHPSMGPAQIRAQLKRFKGWRLSVRLIARILKRNGYELVHVGSRPKDKEFGSFEASHRNALWQMDFVELRVGPVRVSLLLILDDFSRFLVGWSLLTEPDSEAVVTALKEAIRRHGKPEAIYTDRGGPFVAWKKPTSLKNFLEVELIDHHVGPSYRPQGRGKVEALAGTVQRELWNICHFSTVDEARQRLEEFVRWYNTARAHMGIDGLTPADRFFGRWEEVKSQVDALSRQRHGASSLELAPRVLEEVGGERGPVEVLRLMVLDGQASLRFLGHRIDLGPVKA